MKRRSFLKYVSVLTPVVGAENLVARRRPSASSARDAQPASGGKYQPGRITNEYIHFLAGEKEALQDVPKVLAIDRAAVRAQCFVMLAADPEGP